MEVPFHLSQQPFNGRQVAPQGSRHEMGSMVPVEERRPFSGNQRPPADIPTQNLNLPGNLVSPQKIVCVQPLDILTLAQGKAFVPSCGGTVIFLAYDFDLL